MDYQKLKKRLEGLEQRLDGQNEGVYEAVQEIWGCKPWRPSGNDYNEVF